MLASKDMLFQKQTYGQEEIRDIVSDVDGDTHVREMEPVAQPDQADSDDVVGDQLLEILPRLLQHQQQHNSLLGPVTSLEKVVRLDNGFVGTVGETFVHADGVEVPHGSA